MIRMVSLEGSFELGCFVHEIPNSGPSIQLKCNLSDSFYEDWVKLDSLDLNDVESSLMQ